MSDLYRIADQGNVRILTVYDLLGDYANRQILEIVQRSFDAGKCNFIVDLSQINVLNSVGLNFLLAMRSRTKENGGHLVVCGVNERVMQLLEMTKLIPMFNLAKGIEEGLSRHRRLRT